MLNQKNFRPDRMLLHRATKNENLVLTSVSYAREVFIGDGKKYEEILGKMNKEKARKYCDNEYVARCEKILKRLEPSYKRYLLWKENNGIIR